MYKASGGLIDLRVVDRIAKRFQWGLCALRHGIQISMEAILACHPARSTEWLDCHTKSCELWRIRTGPIYARPCWAASTHVHFLSRLLFAPLSGLLQCQFPLHRRHPVHSLRLPSFVLLKSQSSRRTPVQLHVPTKQCSQNGKEERKLWSNQTGSCCCNA